ncbi:MAG TPA: hypothetical protein VJJ24_01750 [Candidatus Paceibacterota bacterium]
MITLEQKELDQVEITYAQVRLAIDFMYQGLDNLADLLEMLAKMTAKTS